MIALKAAFYSIYIKKAKTPKLVIQNLAHVINNFDRVREVTIDVPGGMGVGRADAMSSEITLFSSFNDFVENYFYIRTVNAMNFTKFDLQKLKIVNKVTTIELKEIDKLNGGDGSHLFAH